MRIIENISKGVMLLLAACITSTASAQSEIVHWSFNKLYTISNGVGTPNATDCKSNGSVNLHNVKLKPNAMLGTGEYYLTTVRPTKGANDVGAQDDKGAYHEVNAISCDGAALHMTSPVPTPEAESNTWMWGTQENKFPNDTKYSYQNPYNYFELEVNTQNYKDIQLKLKAAAHTSQTQYYAVAYSTDRSAWTIIGDEYLTGASYNQWKTTTVDLPIANMEKAYIRIFPADNWKANASVSQDNQFNLDDVHILGTLTADRAEITGLSIDGQKVTAGTGYDYECLLPAGNTAATTTIKVASAFATVSATAKAKNGAAVNVTDNGDGTFSLPTPAENTYTVVTFTVAPNSGAVAEKTTYTLYLFQKGNITLSSLTMDGTAVDASILTAINTGNAYTATITGKIYTAEPVIKATVVDGSTPTITSTIINGTATYSIKASDRIFTLIIENVYVYNMTEKDEIVNLKYLTEYKLSKTKWSNGLYSLESDSIHGMNGTRFVFVADDANATTADYKFSVPEGVVIKKFSLISYSASRGNGDGIVKFSSEGATVHLPTYAGYKRGKVGAVAVIIDNHQPGKPVEFTMTTNGSPYAEIELVIEKTDPKTAPKVMDKAASVTNNHATISIMFDREMTTSSATIDTKTVIATGGAVLNFNVTDLEYNKVYTLTIPAGGAKDVFGNATTEAINYEFQTGSKPVATKAAFDYVVSNNDEFKAALAGVKASNSAATAERKTILILDGDYNFGAEEQRIYANNVSLIGQSRDGVVIRGTRNGISNPVLNLRDRSGFYLQDLTLQNDFNWRMDNKNTGQAVAVYGGNKTIMKNVRMHSNQDTQVTGERSYFDRCEIHGTVDFICGGGDNFYDQCDIIIEDRGGNVIAAPNSVPTLKWGYVFSNCTISAVEGAKEAIDGSYNLGRPWQNEPRIAYINTKMNILPDANGWTGMSTLTTHFYEYGSVDKNGKAIDLSVRGNSSTSTNKYTPILTKEQADAHTIYNVMATSTDGWLPTDYTTLTSAPKNVNVEGGRISWDNDDQVRAYVFFKDGKYVGNTAENYYCPAEIGTYTIRTANDMGGLSTEFAEVTITTTGIEVVSFDNGNNTNSGWYNLNGQRIDTPKRGVFIHNGKKIVVR